MAECVDLNDEKPNEYEYENDMKPNKGRMDMDMDMDHKPSGDMSVAIDSLGYRCVCQDGFEGIGIGKEGCAKPEAERIDECESLKNACGRNSMCADLADGYECECEKGYKSQTRDGKNCIKPTDVVDPTDSDRCDGFCEYSKKAPECQLRDLSSL